MKDVEEPIHAFAFINRTLMELSNSEQTEFRGVVISRIPELLNLNRLQSYFFMKLPCILILLSRFIWKALI